MPKTNISSRAVVLVVEDEPLLRMDALDLVEEAGFVALEARNADEAIAIIERRNDIAIIFTDIDMPGSMNGALLAHAVRNRWPPIKIIVTSGHFTAKDFKLPEGVEYYSKPYDHRQISQALLRLASAS